MNIHKKKSDLSGVTSRALRARRANIQGHSMR